MEILILNNVNKRNNEPKNNGKYCKEGLKIKNEPVRTEIGHTIARRKVPTKGPYWLNVGILSNSLNIISLLICSSKVIYEKPIT